MAAIGGKDSASGTFKTKDGETIHVPTTLIAMTNSPQDSAKIVSAEFQQKDRRVIYFPFPRNESGLPDWEHYKLVLRDVSGLHRAGNVAAATVVEE